MNVGARRRLAAATEHLAPALLDRISLGGLVLLVLLAPLPFGSVSRTSIFVLGLWTSLLAWLVLAARPLSSLPVPLRRAPLVLVTLLTIGAATVVPLPRAVASVLSPRAVARIDALPWASTPADSWLSLPTSWVRISAHPEATVAYLVRMATLAVLFLVAAALASKARGHRAILGAVLGTGVFQALYGSYEYLSGHEHIFTYQKRFYLGSATGTYVNQNHFAGLLEMSLLAGIGFLLSRRRPREATGRRWRGWRQRLLSLFQEEGAATIALATAVAVVGLGLVLSYSRAGLVSAAIASILVLVIDARRHRGRRWRAPVLILLAGVLVLITLAGWSRVESDLWKQMQGLSWDEGRVRVWRDCVAIVADHPILGTGLGTFRDIYSAYRSPSVQLVYEYAHNDYIQILVETGLAGFLAALAAIVLYWRTVVRAARKRYAPDLPLLLGAAGGLVSLMLHETIDFNLQIPANAAIFTVIAGTLVGALHPEEPADGGRSARVVSLLSRLKGGRGVRRAEAAS